MSGEGVRQPGGADAERRWRPEWPCPATLILGQQRHGAQDPSYAVDRDGAHWRAFRTPLGAGTLRVRARPGEGQVDLAAWGPGADWLLTAAPGLLGAEDDPTDFAVQHPVVARLHRRFPDWRFGRSGLVLDALVPAIIEQKVTGREAFDSYAALLRAHGEVAPGPVPRRADRRRVGRSEPRTDPLRVPPHADVLARIPSWEWLRLGIDGARSSTVVRVARVAAGLQRVGLLEAAAAERGLRSVRGVGLWTVAETRRRSAGDADAVSFGDYHVASNVGWALTGTPVDDAGMAELLEPYRPHRGRVTELIALAGLAPARRGPRMAPRDHLPTGPTRR